MIIYELACDRCSELLGIFHTDENALKKMAKNKGWKIYNQIDHDYYLCPECAAELFKKNPNLAEERWFFSTGRIKPEYFADIETHVFNSEDDIETEDVMVLCSDGSVTNDYRETYGEERDTTLWKWANHTEEEVIAWKFLSK